MIRRGFILVAGLATLLNISAAFPAAAYVDLAPTLNRILRESQHVVLVEVDRVNWEKSALVLKKVRDLKGVSADEPIRHVLAGIDGAMPRQAAEFAEPGRRAVWFATQNTGLLCTGPAWYAVDNARDGTWRLGAERSELPLAYCGTLTRLTGAVEKMLAGRQAIITMMIHGGGTDGEGANFDCALDRGSLLGAVPLQRVRANLNMPVEAFAISAQAAYVVGNGAAGVEELPEIIERLKNGDETARVDSANDLLSLGAQAAPARGALETLLGDASARVRLAAGAALLRIDPKHAAAVKVISAGLRSEDATVRKEAAHAAGLCGSGGSVFARRLGAMLSDPSVQVRRMSLLAIASLGKDAAAAGDAVIALLDEPRPAPDARDANAPSMFADAVDTLGRIGPAVRKAQPRLAELLNAPDERLRWVALRAMSQIGGPEARPAVRFMMEHLQAGQFTEPQGYNMMVYLGQIGPDAKEAVSLLQNLNIKNRMLRPCALWAIEPETLFPWIGIESALTATRFEYPRMIFVNFLDELGERFRPASAALARRIVAGTAGNVPPYAYRVFVRFPDEALPVLMGALESENVEVRARAVTALGHMKNTAEPAREKLKELVQRGDVVERVFVEWCIGELEKVGER